MENPYFKDEIFFAKQKTLPLEACHLKETLVEGLPWSDFLWGIDSLKIANTDVKIGPLKNFLFRTSRNSEAATKALLKTSQKQGVETESPQQKDHQESPQSSISKPDCK